MCKCPVEQDIFFLYLADENSPATLWKLSQKWSLRLKGLSRFDFANIFVMLLIDFLLIY